jgi:two-component system OmpR family response regulator
MSVSYLEDPKGLTVQRPTQQLDRAPVLVVEDEPDLAEEIRLELEANGHPVRLAASAAEALSAARAGWATVIAFDRMLQRDDGLSVVETLRSEGVATAILVISALSSVDERIRGLKAGGDDYLIKPFAVRELTARVDALLRRRGACRDGSDSWS